MVCKFLNKKSKGSGIKTIPNQQLHTELHKWILENLKKRKVYSSFKGNIWWVALADMQLISKYDKGIRYISCAIDLFSKYLWVVPLKYKNMVTIVNAFQSILGSSKRKPNKVWFDQGTKFYNKSFKKWSEDNYIKMYSTYNEGKSVVAGRFFRTL